MLLLLARWIHKTHHNCTIIVRSSTITVDLYGLQSTKKNKPVSPVGYPRRAYFSYPTNYAIGEWVHGSLDEPILKFGSWSARDKGIASERSVGGIANRENGHGTASPLL